jgi:hypothetical protein
MCYNIILSISLSVNSHIYHVLLLQRRYANNVIFLLTRSPPDVSSRFPNIQSVSESFAESELLATTELGPQTDYSKIGILRVLLTHLLYSCPELNIAELSS